LSAKWLREKSALTMGLLRGLLSISGAATVFVSKIVHKFVRLSGFCWGLGRSEFQAVPLGLALARISAPHDADGQQGSAVWEKIRAAAVIAAKWQMRRFTARSSLPHNCHPAVARDVYRTTLPPSTPRSEIP
jgi:hypothetical protein